MREAREGRRLLQPRLQRAVGVRLMPLSVRVL
jgi:hypothetical protein